MNVLVVDDDKVIRESIADFLSGLDCKVSVSSNGVDALGILKRKSIDCVLSEIPMPKMDGHCPGPSKLSLEPGK
jgi:two-component system capsular synthesis sensor histidine kinase RcsC